MPEPNLFALVESDQALTSYGPEFIDTTHPPSDLSARIKEIQEYLRKVKAIEKDFPDDLDLNKDVNHINDPIIARYNEWLSKNTCIQLKEDKFKAPGEKFFTVDDSTNDMTYRKAYIKFLKENFEQLKNTSEDIKQSNLEKFLNSGKEIADNGKSFTGFELYQQALKEEMSSTPFKRAVFYDSLKIYKTDKDIDKKPVLCLLGPSGSGKSFSRDAFFKDAFPDGSKNQLMVFSADNGIPRGQSKMLALTKQVLETTGHLVLDLDKSSKEIYKEFKVHIRELGLKIQSENDNTKFGLFIPETFAKTSLDFSIFTNQAEDGYKYLKMLGMQPRDFKGIEFFAGKITHEDAALFPHIVKIMAEQRAHPELASIVGAKNSPQPFTFYPTDLKEYKKYSSWKPAYTIANLNTSFVAGMKSANTVIDAWKDAKYPMNFVTVTNDLILVRKDTSSNNWIECSKDDVVKFAKKHLTEPDKNYQVVSHVVYKNWCNSEKTEDLMDYAKKNRKPPKIVVEDAKTLIEDASKTLNLKKIQRSVKTSINQQCIDGMSKDGMLALAKMCLDNPEFQEKFPTFYEAVLKNPSVIPKDEPTSLDDDASYQRVLTHMHSRIRNG